MLLLCNAVCSGAGRAAELKGFLLKPALITHRQDEPGGGFLFSGTKQSGTNSSGQTVYDKHSDRNQSAASSSVSNAPKNPWEGLDEIRRFAPAQGFDSIPPEWIGTYFRWVGVCTPQGDGAGVTGGQGGEGRSLQCFMVRIRIPNGLLRSDQPANHCRPHPPAMLTELRYHRPPKYSVALGHDRGPFQMYSKRSARVGIEHDERLRRYVHGAECHRLPGRGSGRGRDLPMLRL